MTNYLIRRLLLVIPTLFFASLITFVTIRLIPGDVIDQMLKERESTNPGVDRAMIERSLGLDAPMHVQYGRWVAGIVLRGDMGKSLWSGTPVTQAILTRLPVTFELGLISLLIGLFISLPIGIFSAVRQDSLGDYLARGFAILCIALPGFWLGTMIIIFPAKWWGWSPPLTLIKFFDSPFQNLLQFLPPAIVLGTGLAGVSMRMTRSMMLEVLRQDYVRTAWAKGLRERAVVMRHALKNSLIPIVILIGLQMPVLVGGVVIIEQIFNLPGLGRLLVEAVSYRDYTMIMGIMLFFGLGMVCINLIVDLTYSFLDPRIRYK